MKPWTPGDLFTEDEVGRAHPAEFPDAVLRVIVPFLEPGWLVADPFAGVGGVHRLRDLAGVDTIGIEIEPEWASRHPETICGDALTVDLDLGSRLFDAIVTSPTYGNRMADHHEATDASLRLTYRHALGRPLAASNSGALQWGPKYRQLHVLAWTRWTSLLRPGGLFLLNIKDHVRRGHRQAVSAWHVKTLLDLGLEFVDCVPVASGGHGFTAHWQQRVDAELVWALKRPETNG